MEQQIEIPNQPSQSISDTILETIVIGAGHAGLSISYYLKQYGLEHIVFERGHIGESWRSQRWDSFVLNTANGINVLPGNEYSDDDPGKFNSSSKFITSLEAYATKFQLPVAEQTEVISVEKPEERAYFTVTVSENGRIKGYQSRQVIVCSGSQNKKKIPAFAKNLTKDIVQLHTSEYRNASQLPEGSVLVVGSGQSGCQIADDLATQGRKVYLSTSMVARVPRYYRGKDIIDWLITIKFFDVKAEEVTDPKMLHMTPPQLTGTGGGRNTISMQALAKKGVTIVGKMENVDVGQAYFQANAALHVQFADGFSQKVKEMIDEFIAAHQLNTPAPEEDPADRADPEATCASPITKLHLRSHAIQSIIWTTGFGADFTYLKLPVLDISGNPKHKCGISEVEGLYFLGLPWLRTRKSSLIAGIKDDAEFISKKIYQYAQRLDLAP